MVDGNANLTEVTATLGAACSFASHLDCRKEQTHQDGHDRNNNQKLNEGKRRMPRRFAGVCMFTILQV